MRPLLRLGAVAALLLASSAGPAGAQDRESLERSAPAELRRDYGIHGFYIAGAKAESFPLAGRGLTLTIALKLHAAAEGGRLVDRLAVIGIVHPSGLDPRDAANDKALHDIRAPVLLRTFTLTERSGVFQLDESERDSRRKLSLSIGPDRRIQLAHADGRGPKFDTSFDELRKLRAAQAQGGELLNRAGWNMRVLPQGGNRVTYLCFPADRDGRLFGDVPGELVDGVCR